MRLVVVAGNPKPASRTLDAAVRLGTRLARSEPEVVVDAVELGAGLLGWGDPGVAAAVAAMKDADVVVVASPTYKATYSGVLKTLLDHVGGGELAGVPTVPLMLGAGPGHAMAPEVHLRPLLVEIGACVPWPAVYQLDSAYLEDPALDSWLERAIPVLDALVAVRSVAAVD